MRPLSREAENSEQALEGYLWLGDILVAVDGDEIVGHLQLVAQKDSGIELKSMAVVQTRRGLGIGRLLVETAIQRCRETGATRLTVSTAAADVGNLRFYQRLGFRMLRVERDVFGPEAEYPDGILIDGIPLRDQVWLDQVCEPWEGLQVTSVWFVRLSHPVSARPSVLCTVNAAGRSS